EGDAARAADPERLQADHHARHAPDGIGRGRTLRAPFRHPLRPNVHPLVGPPFDDPYDPNVHPLIAQGIMTAGQAMASALVSEGKGGVEWLSRYDLWSAARQYMVYHRQARIITEIASDNLADPLITQDGAPMGPQEARWNFPLPYRKSEWRLRDMLDYGNTVALAGMSYVAKYRTQWLENFYRIHADWVNRTDPPYAFVVPAAQPDPFETFEMLDILRTGDVEIHQAKAAFKAG